MRIILISTPIGFIGSGKGGGVELTLNSLVSGFLSLGHSVDVIAPKNSKLNEIKPETKEFKVNSTPPPLPLPKYPIGVLIKTILIIRLFTKRHLLNSSIRKLIFP